MDWLGHDLRLAVRTLARRPAFSALVTLTLAIGLGLNAVAFSAVDAVLLRPLRVPNARHLGWLGIGPASDPWGSPVSVPVFDAIARQTQTLSGVAAEGQSELALDVNGSTRPAFVDLVSRDFFTLVTVPPERGRVLGAADEGGAGIAALVSHRFWQQELGGRESVIGTILTLNTARVTIVGVLPDDYEGPGGIYAPEVWLPLTARRALGLSIDLDAADHGWLSVIAEPRPNVTQAAIEGDVTPIARSAAPLPASPRNALHARFQRFADGNPSSDVRAIRKVAAAGLLMVGAVLLIACFNVASLLLARSVERRHDFGIRSAIGASRWRLIRQLITEGLVLAAAAAALALLVAAWSGSLLAVFSLPAPEPQRLRLIVDVPMLVYTGALAIIATLVPAAMPAWQVARADLVPWIRGASNQAIGGVRQSRARTTFVILQVAGSTMFLVAALLFVRYFARSVSADPGFDVSRTALLELTPSAYGYSPQGARQLADEIVSRLEHRPGVTSVAVADAVPVTIGSPRMTPVSTGSRNCAADPCPQAQLIGVTPAYFETMGLRVSVGRPFEADQRDDVLVSAAAAADWWPHQNAVGQMVREGRDGRPRHVVGIVGDVVLMAGRPAGAKLYVPIDASEYAGAFTIVARASSDGVDQAAEVAAAMSAVAHDLAPGVPAAVSTMQARMALPLWLPKTLAGFFGVCGMLALALATVGLFGVTHVVVGQRTREFGLRAALGATVVDLRQLVVGDAVRLVAPGIAIGVGAAIATGMLLSSTIVAFGTPTAGICGLAAAVELVVALAASWSPARRASKADPLVVLRAN